VVGRTIPAAFNLLYRMERACEVQVMALVLQYQADLSAEGSVGSDLRQGEAAPEPAEPQRRPGVARIAAQARSCRQLIQELTHKR